MNCLSEQMPLSTAKPHGGHRGPKGSLKFLNKQAWSWYFLDGLKKKFTDVFEAMRLNMEDTEANKKPFNMGGKTFDLGSMKVSFDGKSDQLEKSARNIRKRPDANAKKDTSSLFSFRKTKEHEFLIWEFED